MHRRGGRTDSAIFVRLIMHEWWAEDHTGGEVADQKPEVRLCFPESIGTTYCAVKRPLPSVLRERNRKRRNG